MKFRGQIENHVSDDMLLRAFSFVLFHLSTILFYLLLFSRD